MRLTDLRKQRIEGMYKILQKEALCRRQLQDLLNCCIGSVDEYLRELRRKKRIYVEYWVRTEGQVSPYWRAGDKPNAPKPQPLSRYQYLVRYRKRARNQVYTPIEERPKEDVVLKKPRRDIAASWF